MSHFILEWAATATSDFNPLWSLLDQDLNRDLFQFYKQLIALRKATLALLTGQIEFCYESVEDSILTYRRWADDKSQVVVIVNLGDRAFPAYAVPNWPTDGVWRDGLGDAQFEVKGGSLTIELPLFSARVLIG